MHSFTLLVALVVPANLTADVLVYGGTPAGIAASISAAKSGRRVILVEPYSRVGGLVTNGLSHTDFRTFEGITGTFYELSQRVQKYYANKYGADSQQVKNTFRGTHAEPHVNQLLFEQMLAEYPRIRVLTKHRLQKLHVENDHITQAELLFDKGKRIVAAKMYIDASYEGDLMALAGVEYRVGRESRPTYNEPLAPEEGDEQVQGYNFRFIMRNDDKRVLVTKPEGYRREDFLPVVKILGTPRVKSVFCRSTGGLIKAHDPILPNGKYDMNDVSRAPVRLSLPDVNDAWPKGTLDVRQRIFAEHVRHNVGLLYFLQHDPAVPNKYRDEARGWGWCKDEFADTGHIPEQLYVREARRMVGQHVFTEHDTDHAASDARAVLHLDSIAMGDYGPNCHGTAHEGPRFGGKHTGEFYKPVSPYQIPYGVLVPKKIDNLLVPVACSASHVGFCALRLEPIWTSLGQAAGYAAHVALDETEPVQRVPVARVQSLLHNDGAATIYTSDIGVSSPDFAAVQWWGTQGGLHGLAPKPGKPGQRGEHLRGQYYHAFPGHAVEVDKPLTDNLRKRWTNLADKLGVDTDKLAESPTRGEFIRKAYALTHSLR